MVWCLLYKDMDMCSINIQLKNIFLNSKNGVEHVFPYAKLEVWTLYTEKIIFYTVDSW